MIVQQEKKEELELLLSTDLRSGKFTFLHPHRIFSVEIVLTYNIMLVSGILHTDLTFAYIMK